MNFASICVLLAEILVVDLLRADGKVVSWKDESTGNGLLHLMAYSNMHLQTALLLKYEAPADAKNKVQYIGMVLYCGASYCDLIYIVVLKSTGR
mgnify:CR=1 FL=1